MPLVDAMVEQLATARQILEDHRGRTSEITVEEIAQLTAVFGDGGEMAAERMS